MQLSVASLELFNLLVDLNCEDFILEAILRLGVQDTLPENAFKKLTLWWTWKEVM